MNDYKRYVDKAWHTPDLIITDYGYAQIRFLIIVGGVLGFLLGWMLRGVLDIIM